MFYSMIGNYFIIRFFNLLIPSLIVEVEAAQDNLMHDDSPKASPGTIASPDSSKAYLQKARESVNFSGNWGNA